MRGDRYRQCRMERYIDGARMETTSYIPEKFAREGMTLSLKDEGVWTHGWSVTLASSEVVTDPEDWRKLVKGHRKMTGDSTPRTS